MSNPPKLIISIVVAASRILGKAFYEAGRQAVKNAKHSPQAALAGDAAGVGNATSGSVTDQLTRTHRMTLDEAHLILNSKKGDGMEAILKHYEHLFKANSPPPPAPKPTSGRAPPPPAHSHYLQSKVVRARERIEAEVKASESPAQAQPSAKTQGVGGESPPSNTTS
ncbi:hypothetical protein ONZ45_g6606 [Pleurotus djamor]|nr:hypothetical protein ONZ45_g6606 [Pleurotus djamor]